MCLQAPCYIFSADRKSSVEFRTHSSLTEIRPRTRNLSTKHRRVTRSAGLKLFEFPSTTKLHDPFSLSLYTLQAWFDVRLILALAGCERARSKLHRNEKHEEIAKVCRVNDAVVKKLRNRITGREISEFLDEDGVLVSFVCLFRFAGEPREIFSKFSPRWSALRAPRFKS